MPCQLSNTTTVILVRHGETHDNIRQCFSASGDVPLTPEGRNQSAQVAVRLAREFQPGRVFTSEYLRAMQTGEIIAAQLGLKTEAIPGIQEREFGCLKGCSYEDLGRMMDSDPSYDPESFQNWAPDGAESLQEVRIRAVAAINKICAAHPGGQIVVVSHGAVIQSISAHLTGTWTEAAVPPNCGILTIEYEGDSIVCISPEKVGDRKRRLLVP